MAETPDFDAIATSLITRAFRPDANLGTVINGMWEEAFAGAVAEQLRLVWNARGAADITKLEAELPGDVTKRLDAALRSLDR